jgi:RimJ/RimL family protein N-acetyltransferase
MTGILETRRLILRPLRESDLVPLAAAVNNRRITNNTARIPWPYTLNDAYAFQRYTVTEPGSLRAVIIGKEKISVIGCISYDASGTVPCAGIGYWLAESVWAKGYGFEAARVVTDHAFTVAGHGYLVAGYRKGNEASRRILDRLGFRVTGHALNRSRGAGCMQPITRLELTAREWMKRKDRGE